MSDKKRRSLKILYVNHYGIFGGSFRSILELISGFPKDAVKPYFITPKGKGEKVLKNLGIPYTTVSGGMSKFDHTRMGYYKGFRWLILIREIFYSVPTALTLWKFRKKAHEFDIVHLNEITCILPMILAKRWYKKPVIVHARAVFYNNQKKLRTRAILRILDKYSDKIIPIDQTVAASIPLPNKLAIIHNSFSLSSRLAKSDDSFAAKIATLPKRKLTIGFIGAIHLNKGIMELIEAVKLCRDNNLDVSLVIAGNGNMEKRTFLNAGINLLGLNQDKNKLLEDFITVNNLQDYIHLLGFSTNTDAFFEYIDVICFPSYYDAPGRPVFEAAFFHKPSMLAVRNPFPDTFIEGETGLKVQEKNPGSVFNSIKKLYDHPELIRQMGEKAYKLAETNFSREKNALKVLNIYHSLVQ